MYLNLDAARAEFFFAGSFSFLYVAVLQAKDC